MNRILVLILSASNVFADTGVCVQQTGTVVVFGNGIKDTELAADRSEAWLNIA